ncbi:MAG: hypothetical protein CMIDDMOC_00196 [Sodalis sp. Fle]|nr:MAG: hypothetical protein CMIDDMOC_00196 [Sodalis sp. Fle]
MVQQDIVTKKPSNYAMIFKNLPNRHEHLTLVKQSPLHRPNLTCISKQSKNTNITIDSQQYN